MVFIDALLAFAITLLSLSLVGTMLVDLVIRRLRLRSNGLRTVLVKLYLDFLSFNKIAVNPAVAAAEADTFALTIIDYAGVKERPSPPVPPAPPPPPPIPPPPHPPPPLPVLQTVSDQPPHLTTFLP